MLDCYTDSDAHPIVAANCSVFPKGKESGLLARDSNSIRIHTELFNGI